MSEQLTISSLGESEELSADEVTISGDVCQESILDAHKLTVKGTTHQDSTQFSKFANIHTHKGTLRCHEAKITLLDEGEVHATSLIVDTVSGGEIYAQDVTIKHLLNNTSIYASHSITIENINGENNTLKINYKEIPILVSKIDLIDDDIEELAFSLEKAKRDNSLLEKDIKIEIKNLQIEKDKIINSSQTAKITITKEITTQNTISFQINQEEEISYTTEVGLYTPFSLKFSQNTITLYPTQETIILK